MPVLYAVQNDEDIGENAENDQQEEQILHNNGQNGHVEESMETVLLRVHTTALNAATDLNIYMQLGIHICCFACHSECNNMCEGNLAEHIAGNFTDHLIIMHFLQYHPTASSVALWHNSNLRTF